MEIVIFAILATIYKLFALKKVHDIDHLTLSWPKRVQYIFIYLFIIGFYIPPTCANTSERLTDLRVWYLGPLLWFLAAPQIVHFLSNAKFAA